MVVSMVPEVDIVISVDVDLEHIPLLDLDEPRFGEGIASIVIIFCGISAYCWCVNRITIFFSDILLDATRMPVPSGLRLHRNILSQNGYRM